VRLVIEQEWPAQQAGRTNIEGWKPLFKLNREIAKFAPLGLRDVPAMGIPHSKGQD
jgi:hypothetical protein